MSQMSFREFLIMCSIYMTNDVLNEKSNPPAMLGRME